ncbi:MAG: nuclear transport factor 2 family protein [Bacteroidota bacterium]
MKQILLLSMLSSFAIMAYGQTPEELAQAQLDAYNNRDLEAFLEPYSDTVKIYNFPKVLSMEGKDAMRERYGSMFRNMTDLNCELINRMVSGNTVIDQESVLFEKGKPRMQAFAIYKVEHQKIQEVYFILPEQAEE